MSAATPSMTPPPIDPVQPGLSEGARLVNTFFAPTKTFEDLRRKASWWVPYVLISIVTVVFGVVAIQKVDMVQLSRHQVERIKFAQQQFEKLPPDQQEQSLIGSARRNKISLLAGGPIGAILGALIGGSVLMAIFNFGFAAEVPFGRSLAIVMYGWLPAVIKTVLITISLLVSSEPNGVDILGNAVPTNPGFFMNPETANKFLYGLASGFDVIYLWIVVLFGLGFSVNSSNRKLSPGTAIGMVFAIYALIVLVGAGLKAAF